jgi:hypothetical protein
MIPPRHPPSRVQASGRVAERSEVGRGFLPRRPATPVSPRSLEFEVQRKITDYFQNSRRFQTGGWGFPLHLQRGAGKFPVEPNRQTKFGNSEFSRRKTANRQSQNRDQGKNRRHGRAPPPSRPRLSRASTPFLRQPREQGVGGRDKPGHDSGDTSTRPESALKIDPRTHWKTPPCHGAHPKRVRAEALVAADARRIESEPFE